VPDPGSLRPEGEPAFREREKAALRDALSVKGCVIATGGGAFSDEENRVLLRSYAPVVYLEAAVETILERLRGSRASAASRGRSGRGRPGVVVAPGPGYRTADVTVRTDGQTVEEVAGQVADWIDRRRERRIEL